MKRKRSLGWRGVAVAMLALGASAGLVSQGRVQGLLLNSLYLAAGSAAIALPLGASLALLLFRAKLYGHRLLFLLLILLLFLPLPLLVAGWDAGLGKLGWLSFATSGGGKVPWLSGWRAAILLHAFASIPWVTALVGAALALGKPEYEEQAALEGSPWQIFTRVTLPQIRGPLFIGAIWVMVITLGEMTISDIYQIRTFTEELYVGYALDGGADPLPRQSLPGWLALACVIGASLLLCSKLAPPEASAPPRPSFRYPLGRRKILVSLLAGGILALMLLVPLLNLMMQVGIKVDWEGGGPVRRWSAEKGLFELSRVPWRFAHEFGWTLILASTASTATLLVSLPLAWYAAKGGWRRLLVILPAGIGLAAPGPTIGLTIIALFNQPSLPLVGWLYDHSIAAPVIALVVRALPIYLLLLWHLFASLASDPMEHAKTEGVSAWHRFWKVVIPQRKASIALVWLVGLAIGIGDLSATILVLPPGMTTLSNRIFSLLHYGVEEQLAALCLAEMALISVLAMIIATLLRRNRKNLW